MTMPSPRLLIGNYFEPFVNPNPRSDDDSGVLRIRNFKSHNEDAGIDNDVTLLVDELVDLHRSGQDDDEFQDTSKGIEIIDEKILFKIFTHLKLEDLLTCRTVCNLWNTLICKSSSKLLWPKACLVLASENTINVNAELNQTITEWNLWKRFGDFPLIAKHQFPNLRIQHMNLCHENVKTFFKTYGQQIKYLDIFDCELSLVTFQRIQSFCPDLEYFKLKPVPYYSIIYGGGISCPFRPTTPLFANLKTLILYSDYKKHFYSSKDNNQNVRFDLDYYSADMLENHLNPNVAKELLQSASNLKCLQLYGWTGATVVNVLNSLALQIIPSMLTRLEFHDLVNGFDKLEFGSNLSRLTKFQLESFALTFLNPPLKYSTSGINDIIHHVLRLYSTSLVSINLKNCSINDGIFAHDDELYFGQLEDLDLAGTNVKKLSDFVKLMPKLKRVNFEPKKHEDDIVDDAEYYSEWYLLKTYGYGRSKFSQFLESGKPNVRQLRQIGSFDKFCFSNLAGLIAYLVYPFCIEQFHETLGPICFLLFLSLALVLGLLHVEYKKRQQRSSKKKALKVRSTKYFYK